MKRRKFVKHGSILTASGVLWSCGVQNKNEESSNQTTVQSSSPKMKEPAIQLYTVRKELPDDRLGVLKKLSELGFKYIESYMLEEQHHLGYSVQEYKSILDDLGLQQVSEHVPTGKKDPSVTGTMTNNFDHVIEDAVYLGQKYIICPHLEEFERKTLDDYKSVVELLNICAEKSKSAGLSIGYHNHDFEFEELEGQIPLEMMIKETDPEMVQFELDLYWSTYSGFDAIELFNKYPNRFPLWHVKDMSKITKEDTTFVGDGSIDFKSIFGAAENAGLDYYIVEQEDYPIPVFEGLEKSLSNLKAILG